MAQKKIAITDDERSIRKALREILEFEGYAVIEAQDAYETLELVKKESIDLLFLDIKMKGMDGMELLEKLVQEGAEFPIIMLSGHGNVEIALEATRLGAYTFLEKPPDLNRLLLTVRNALSHQTLHKENKKMRRTIRRVTEIVGESRAIGHIRETIQKVAPTEARVLITGENGTGKELVARWIHEFSKRVSEPFVEVNCAAIPADLLESELFGHEKGSFTGSTHQRIGKFEAANHGTLFLDEIGDMSLDAQAKVLRALQENVIARVGGNTMIPVDVRIVAATNKDLQSAIKEGSFREDLYHRLAVIPIHVPPLSERIEDVPLLAETFLNELVQSDILFTGKSFSNAALEALKEYEWTGNVRQLHNVVERLAILSKEACIEEQDVKQLVYQNKANATFDSIFEEYGSFQDFKDITEQRFIEYHLDKNDWNISQTADMIGIQRSHLYNKIKKFNIKR